MSAGIRLLALRFTGTEPSERMLDAVVRNSPVEFCVRAIPFEKYLPSFPKDKQLWVPTTPLKHGNYSHVDWNDIAPLDEELVEAMYPCEAVVMTTFRRLEWHSTIPYADRKRMYLQHLRYWNDFLLRHNINLFLTSNTPHELPEIIIYELCKHHSIPTFIMTSTSVIDSIIFEESWEESAKELGERYAELAKQSKEVQLSERFEKYFQAQSAPEGTKALIWDVAIPKREFAPTVKDVYSEGPLSFATHVMMFFLRVFSLGFWRKQWGRLQRQLKKRRLLAFYDQHAVRPDAHQQYIYVALHCQPECSTCPMGGVFTEQLLLVQLIAACVPDDVQIYVKEHPKQTEHNRDLAFYQDLIATKNVQLIARDVSTFELRENCIAVATCTGTAGFEALFRGKPVLMFGHHFYQYAPGVFVIRTQEDCQKAIDSIVPGKAGPSAEQMRWFLQALDDVCVQGAHTDFMQRKSLISDEENIQNVSEFLIQKIHDNLDRILAVQL